MASNVASGATGRQYGAGPRVLKESRAVQDAARRLGLRASTVGQMVRARGIHLQTAALISAAIETGDSVLFARLSTPVLAAVQGRPIPVFGPDLQAQVQEADLAEDMAEALYNAHPCPATARRWLAAIRVQQVRHLDLERSLDAEVTR